VHAVLFNRPRIEEMRTVNLSYFRAAKSNYSKWATPEVFRGVLSHVFDQFPEDARAREYSKILVDNAFNNVTALSVLDLQTLLLCAIPVAHYALILRALSGNMPPALSAPTPAVLPGGLTGADGEHTASRGSDTQRIVRATAFCELGACGLPARGPFTAWLVAFIALMSTLVSADCVSALSALLTNPAAVLATVSPLSPPCGVSLPAIVRPYGECG
jgi:hypothetical protein